MTRGRGRAPGPPRPGRFGYAGSLLLVLATLLVFSLLLHEMLVDLRLQLPPGLLTAAFVAVMLLLVLLILRYFLLLWFSYLAQIEGDRPPARHHPPVSIIVPAFNEGLVIEGSIRSLLALEYPALEVIVVDDGSSDDTYQRARRFAGRHGRIELRVLRQSNQGKAAALNAGLELARGEFVVCMDADSRLDPRTLDWALRHFRDPDVGAVAGNVKVGNRDRLLSRLQALEYVEGLNLVRRAQGFFRVVNIIPGPLGVFRREALLGVGGYDTDTFAEDCDLTLSLLVRGWKIHYEPRAVAHTEAPEQLLDLLKQRYRWTRGILQAMRKHRAALVDPRRGFATMGTLWYMVFEGIVWPLTNVSAHLLFLVVAASHGYAMPLFFWLVQLTLLDLAAALYCLAAEEEDMRLAPLAFLYRLFFAVTIDFAKVFATFEELLHLRMGWGKLERIGRL